MYTHTYLSNKPKTKYKKKQCLLLFIVLSDEARAILLPMLLKHKFQRAIIMFTPYARPFRTLQGQSTIR